MSGVVLLTSLDVSAAQTAFARIGDDDLAQIAFAAGAMIEDQTKRRIRAEKTSPDGTPWAPWSDAYRARITKGQRGKARSLLVGTGVPGLLDSIANVTTGMEAVVGSNLIYAAHHQFGSKRDEAKGGGIPARPYLGISPANATALEDLVSTRILELLA